ncbi:UNVERIFIED_CONTAM: hypothetical protein GTU68_010067 [Idotea baltica]|nr:hypothetical protein [Idotea baltica]
MKYYSTKSKDVHVELATAVLKSLPPDNGLYMPVSIPDLSDLVSDIANVDLPEIAFRIAQPYLNEAFSDDDIRQICNEAINFSAPIHSLTKDLHVLELWHGPSLAFKDFGARFMAAVMSRLVSKEDKKLTILVATSGDTGGAVAYGFLGVPNVEVIILYPKDKVSPLQEKQLTTLGQNITALEVDGTFDDCQALVKKAFLDKEINKEYNLSSANSINICRLIPQSFYYFEAFRQISQNDKEVVFCVPSGNFGNLTAGLLAKRMGLPVEKYIAATNLNDVVPSYLETGSYEPKPSVATISNAMDVGNPSNFRRMEDLYRHLWEDMKGDILGYSYNDKTTEEAIAEIYIKYHYTMDPHGAVAYQAATSYQAEHPDHQVVILETAHPAKFLPVMGPILGKIDIPERLAVLKDSKKVATPMEIGFEGFKEWLLENS